MIKQVCMLFTVEDYENLQARFAASTSHSLSSYCRDILISRPVITRYHNTSADEFLLVALELKLELDEVLLTLRQHRSDETIETLSGKIDELKLIMHQIYQQWSST
jgi:hypothetical protein